MKNYFAKVVLLFVISFMISCNSTKKVGEGEYLLRKNEIDKDSKNIDNHELKKYINQNPNSRFLGMPILLSIYNMSSDSSEIKYERWLERHPKMHKFMDKLLSEKQVRRLGESFFISGKDKLLKKIGEEPVIIDSLKLAKSSKTLKTYLKSIGHFNAESDFEVIPDERAKKEAKVKYKLKIGPAYFIDSVSYSIESKQMDSVYKKNIKDVNIKKGDKYSLSSFVKEKERLATLFRNNGFYKFQQEAISFEIGRDTIVQSKDSIINVKTKIGLNTIEEEQFVRKEPYKIHKIRNLKIYTDYDNAYLGVYDSVEYKGITFLYRDRLRFRPSVLYSSVDLRKGDVYSDTYRANSLRHISSMRTFRYPNIEYVDAGQDGEYKKLDVNLYLTPLSRYTMDASLELSNSDIQKLGIGGNLSLGFRNVFRGAETLELIGRGTIGSQKLLFSGGPFFDVFDYGGDIRLTVPRIWFFVPVDRIIPIKMTPQTVLQFGVTNQQNIGIDRQKIQMLYRYNFNPKITDRVTVDLFDIEFVNNKEPGNFFNVYRSSYNYVNNLSKKYSNLHKFYGPDGNLDTEGAPLLFFLYALGSESFLTEEEKLGVINVIERMFRLIKNDLVMATSVTYTSNNSIKYSEPDFEQYRVKLETAGNVPNMIAKMKDDKPEGERELFGVNFSQYVKAEAEYIKHFDFNNNRSLAFRIFTGLAMPYGNSVDIPFSRSYFAGGSNDNRGWNAYSLGPGSVKSPLEFNEANFKFTTNAEYRFTISNAFKGAFFVDAGNIWYALGTKKNSSEEYLDSFKDIEDIAVSTGFGLRYDFGFFVLRADFGFKQYDPSKEKKYRWNQWWNESILDFTKNTLFNFGINYPF